MVYSRLARDSRLTWARGWHVSTALKKPYPICVVSKEKFNDHLNLLLITDGEHRHYVLIKDFDRFTFNQTKYEPKSIFACKKVVVIHGGNNN